MDSLLKDMTVTAARSYPQGLLLLCEKPSHVGRIVAVCTPGAEGGWDVLRSSTIFSDCTAQMDEDGMHLGLYGCTYTVGCGRDGVWCLQHMSLADTEITLTDEWLGHGEDGMTDVRWGKHPWRDLAAMDWSGLPGQDAEAVGWVDPSGWAMVANPDAGDTLHLRAQPETKAYSLGRYLNGTPLRVLSLGRDWLEVSVGGVTGWMRREYVAQNHAMQGVRSELMAKAVAGSDPAALYADAHAAAQTAVLEPGTRVLVMGFAGDDLVHVLAPGRQLYGYMAAERLEP